MSLLLGLEPYQKMGLVDGWLVVGVILGFCFGPNLGLRLEAGTKLNNTERAATTANYLFLGRLLLYV